MSYKLPPCDRGRGYEECTPTVCLRKGVGDMTPHASALVEIEQAIYGRIHGGCDSLDAFYSEFVVILLHHGISPLSGVELETHFRSGNSHKGRTSSDVGLDRTL